MTTVLLSQSFIVWAAPIGVAGGSFPIAADTKDGPETSVVDALVQGHYELDKFNRMHESSTNRIHERTFREPKRRSRLRPLTS